MHHVAEQLNAIGGELETSFFERGDAVEGSLLALLCAEHVCFLGDPGTGKSMLVRYLVSAIENASYFEMLLSKTRPAERVLGPLDIKEFRENGNYFLKRKGFATDSDIVFFDEIGKMSVVLGHDILALLNERVIHEVRDGLSVHNAPLHTAFTASNEVPTNESEDAAALWDRILIRIQVEGVKAKHAFSRMLVDEIPYPKQRIDLGELQKAVATDVPAIEVPNSILVAIVKLREALNDKNIEVSDRRWRQSMKAVRARAFLDGDDVVKDAHLRALRFTLWEDPEQIPIVERLVLSASNPFYDDLEKWGKIASEVEQALRTRKNDTTALATYATEANQKLDAVRKGLDELIVKAGHETVPNLAPVADKHREVMIRAFVECHQMDPDVAIVAAEKKLGLGGGSVTRAMA